MNVLNKTIYVVLNVVETSNVEPIEVVEDNIHLNGKNRKIF